MFRSYSGQIGRERCPVVRLGFGRPLPKTCVLVVPATPTFSHAAQTDVADMERRMHLHRCRMLARVIQASPVGTEGSPGINLSDYRQTIVPGSWKYCPADMDIGFEYMSPFASSNTQLPPPSAAAIHHDDPVPAPAVAPAAVATWRKGWQGPGS